MVVSVCLDCVFGCFSLVILWCWVVLLFVLLILWLVRVGLVYWWVWLVFAFASFELVVGLFGLICWLGWVVSCLVGLLGVLVLLLILFAGLVNLYSSVVWLLALCMFASGLKCLWCCSLDGFSFDGCWLGWV